MCDAKINTSDWEEAPFLTLGVADVLPSCWEESRPSETPRKMIKGRLLIEPVPEKVSQHKGFLPSPTLDQCLVPEGIITNAGCRREIASHWCDQPHWEGCYGSLWMEWLRTNGVCFPAAGMGKRALIECTEKGIFLNNGRIVHLVRGRADIQ